jgi:hypothetical protein
MFIGTFAHMALRWIIAENRRYDKIAEINQLINLLSSAVAVQDNLDYTYDVKHKRWSGLFEQGIGIH